MSKALIGYSGFVGGNLDQQMEFTHKYNSKNISTIDGNEFDLLVCAGVPAVKWLANKEPENDKRIIDGLVKYLDAIKVRKFVLISTIDVYPVPIDVDENSEIDLSACHPYGRHRLELERFISEKFDAYIIRLPGLFGAGLKKNIIYDFLNNNNIDQINSRGIFQFYCLDHIADDIAVALKHDVRKLNITTEPISVAEVAEVCLGGGFQNPAIDCPAVRYDYKSIYADRFGGQNGYMYSKQQVLNDLHDYVGKVRD